MTAVMCWLLIIALWAASAEETRGCEVLDPHRVQLALYQPAIDAVISFGVLSKRGLSLIHCPNGTRERRVGFTVVPVVVKNDTEAIVTWVNAMLEDNNFMPLWESDGEHHEAVYVAKVDIILLGITDEERFARGGPIEMLSLLDGRAQIKAWKKEYQSRKFNELMTEMMLDGGGERLLAE